MGVTAYLEITSSKDADPGLTDSRVLYYAKGLLPFAWFLFFEADDFAEVRSRVDGSSYTLLRREKAKALRLAEGRVEKLGRFASSELSAALNGFLAAVANTGGAVLVLNSHRMESTREQLVEPLKWLGSLSKRRPSAKRVAEAESLFEDALEWNEEPDDDEPLVEIADEDALTGHPGDALAVVENSAPKIAAPLPTPEAALMGVYTEPHSLEARVRCGEALVARGDPRGELILLDSRGPENRKQERQREKLWEQYSSEVERPIRQSGASASDWIGMQHGFPAEVRLARPIPGPFGPQWSTVHTIELKGSPHFFVRPELWWLRRVVISSPDVLELARYQALPFSSIVVDDQHTGDTWAALAGSPAFASVVEVFVVTFSVWLPPGAQHLAHARPHVALRSGASSPSDDPRALQPVSPAAHEARLARWAAPPQGAQLAGARFDNQ